MPSRPDLDSVAEAKAKARGINRLNNQAVIDMLQPGDVIVVDMFGKKEQGTLVGDNLFYYIMRATKGAGMVVDGAVRDLEGISNMDMPAYFRHAHPSAIGNMVLAGWNIPVRIGDTTVMPGDLVVGDREGVYFIPPALLEGILNRADETHVHDEWTRKKFDEGKYKSSEIYGSPRDPALRQEYDEYLKKRLEEIKKKELASRAVRNAEPHPYGNHGCESGNGIAIIMLSTGGGSTFSWHEFAKYAAADLGSATGSATLTTSPSGAGT
jgi:regulator of RNase E activity RraA